MIRYGTYGTLQDLYRKNLIDSLLAEADNPASPKNGYYYTLVANGSSSWSCVARPPIWGVDKEGGAYRHDDAFRRNYMIDHGGVLLYNDEKDSNVFTESLGR